MSHCSQCGRYVGPYEACPYCGARVTQRVSIRVIKVAAVGLASVGLVVLWFAATRSPVPRIQIGQAGATTNFAYARVEGWVVRGPDYYGDSGYLGLTVADDTGEIRVSAYRNETEALRAQGRIPALGDRVSVAGTLRVREEGVGLTVNVPDHLEVLRSEAVGRGIGAITPGDRLQRVRVQGQVWQVRQLHEGQTLITLRDRSGAIDVAVGEAVQALTGELLPLEAGQSVEVVGTVDLYRDTPQIVPASVHDVVLLPEPVPVAALTRIHALAPDDAGQLVAVEGRVAEVDSFSAGVKLTLDDGSGALTVLLWQDLIEALEDPAVLTVGAEIQAVGEVSLYGDELEVIPERPLDVVVLGTGEGAASVIPIGDLGPDRVGEAATMEGEVVAVTSFSAGFKFTLDDGTGQVVLLTWLSDYDQLGDPSSLDLGARVRVSGLVQEYEGLFEVVPGAPADVTVLAPGAAMAPLREIRSLAASDVGSLVTVDGAIVRGEAFPGGYRAWLGDGTGEVLILLWASVYERVAGGEPLEPGSWVQVTGAVQEYRGTLEIVPRLPHDVVTTQAP